MEFFKEGNCNSMTRLCMFAVVFTVCVSVIILTIKLCFVISDKTSISDIAMLIGAYTTLLGVVVYGKVSQKKMENKE